MLTGEASLLLSDGLLYAAGLVLGLSPIGWVGRSIGAIIAGVASTKISHYSEKLGEAVYGEVDKIGHWIARYASTWL